MQRYEPRVLLQCALTWQTGDEALHSLISEIGKNNVSKKQQQQQQIQRQNGKRIKSGDKDACG